MFRGFGLLSAGALVCATLGSAAGAAPEQSGKPGFTLADLGSIVRLSAPALSPDGKQAALVVGRPDIKQNRVVNSLVVLDTSSGTARVVATGDVSNPAWAPRGRTLAWLAPDAGKRMQVQALRPDKPGAKPLFVTRSAAGSGVRSFAWSPDAASIAYLAEELSKPISSEARFDRTFGISDSDYLSRSFLAKSDGARPASLWVTTAGGGAPQLLTQNTGHLKGLAWQPDGKAIVVNSQPGASYAASRLGSLISIDVATKHQTTLVAGTAQVSADGRIAVSSRGLVGFQQFHGSDPWTFPNTATVILDGKAKPVTAALDRDVDEVNWLPDGRTLLVKANDHLQTGLWSVEVSGEARRLDLGRVVVGSELAIGASGALAFVGSEPDLPPELYVMASPQTKPVRLTAFNRALSDRRLGKVEQASWKNGGFDHDGVVTYPPHFRPGQKYPLLVRIHGGPESSAAAAYNGESQFYAAKGWLVFEPNYRGSNSQGGRYQTAIIGDLLTGSDADIMAGIEALKARGIVDDKRIAVDGWSWGGVMTSWMIGHHDWCAAIPGALVVNFTDYYSQSEFGFWISTLMGSPYLPENRQKYIDHSPATYLHQAKTPTLIIHNTGDPNAPVTQAYALYYALRDRGVKARLNLRDVEEHGYGDPYHEKNVFVTEMAWLNENCGAGSPEQSARTGQ